MRLVKLVGFRQQPRQGTTYKMFRTNASDEHVPDQEVTDYLEFREMPDPAAPATNKVRLFATDSNGVPFDTAFSEAFGGTGKSQICVRFPTGAVAVLGVEP
jgi:hypothetical protein